MHLPRISAANGWIREQKSLSMGGFPDIEQRGAIPQGGGAYLRWAVSCCKAPTSGWESSKPCAAPEINYLRLRQRPACPLRQIAKAYVADRDAQETQALEAKRVEHAADLAVASFVKLHPDPAVPVSAFQEFDPHGAQQFATLRDAFQHPCGHGLAENAAHLNMVYLAEMGFRIEQALRQHRVIGEEQKPLARLVEPADRREGRNVDMVETAEDRRPALGIVAGGHEAARLVQHEIDPGLRGNDGSVDGDPVRFDIDPLREIGDLPAGDADTPFGDQLFGLRPRAVAELGERPGERHPLTGQFAGLRFSDPPFRRRAALFHRFRLRAPWTMLPLT